MTLPLCSTSGWVACTQYNNTCHGTISKAEWYNREKRGEACNGIFAEQVFLPSLTKM